jgi:hypothetical protein
MGYFEEKLWAEVSDDGWTFDPKKELSATTGSVVQIL